MPDGAKVSFPDTMPADQIKSMILKKFPDADKGVTPTPGKGDPLAMAPGVTKQAQDLPPEPEKGSIIDPLAQGATLGFGDEAAAGIQGAIDWLKGGSFNESYGRKVAQLRDALKSYEARNPATSVAAELVGSVPSMMLPVGEVAKGAGLVRKALAATEAGAAYGAVTGAGKSEGGISDRATGALEGGGIGALGGAAVGTALGAAGSGVRALGTYLSREFPENMTTQAVTKIMKRIGQDQKAGGPSAQDAIDLVNEAARSGKPATLADVGGENVKALAGNVARQPGEARGIMSQFLTQRDQGAASRLSGDISRYVSGGPSMNKTVEALVQSRSAANKDLWANAMSLQGIWSPRMAQFVGDPAVKAGLKRGFELERLESLADNRPFDPTQMGIGTDAEGNVVLQKVPSMRVLQMAKEGIDAMIADERDPLTGRFSKRGVALEKVRKAFLGEIDALDTTGAYKAARDAWSGPSASMDAVRSGSAVFRQSPDEIASEFGKLSAGDQEFYRLGVADAIREKLAKTGLSGDEAKSIIRNPWVRDQLRPIFRSPAEFTAFVDAVTHESRMFGTQRGILGGSQTASRIAEDESGENATAAAGAHAAESIAGGHWISAIKHVLKMIKDKVIQPNPRLNEEIAKLLLQTPISPELEQRMTGRFTGPALINHLETPATVLDTGARYLSPAIGVLSGQSAQ